MATCSICGERHAPSNAIPCEPCKRLIKALAATPHDHARWPLSGNTKLLLDVGRWLCAVVFWLGLWVVAREHTYASAVRRTDLTTLLQVMGVAVATAGAGGYLGLLGLKRYLDED